MTHAIQTSRPASEAPSLIRGSNGLMRRMLRLGVPAGPNLLMTVRGRVSGEPRTAPVAVPEIDGHRYVIGAYGDVQWVRNLRAAGEADLTNRGRTEHVVARELSRPEAVEFFGRTLPGYISRFPWFGRAFARFLFGLVGREVLEDPQRASETRPVFELTSA